MRAGAVLAVASWLGMARPVGAEPPPSATRVPTPGVVVTEDPAAPLVGVCVTGHLGADPYATGVVRERGGQIVEDTPWTRCSLVPSGETEVAIWLAGRWSKARPSGQPPPRFRALMRLSELATEVAPERERREPVCVGISGAVRQADAAAFARRHVSAVLPPRPPVPSQSSERLSVLEDPRADGPELYVGYPLRGASAKELASLWVAATIVGGSSRARLPRLLIHRRGRVDRAGASILMAPAGPLFLIELSVTQHSTIDRVEPYVTGTLKQLRIVGPTAGELERGKALSMTHHLRKLDSATGRASTHAEYYCSLRQGSVAEDVLSELANVTVESVRHVARTYLLPTQRSVVEIYPPGFEQDDPALLGYTIHTVEKGETWQSIARKVRHSVERLARENELDPRYALTPGQGLWIPPADKTTP